MSDQDRKPKPGSSKWFQAPPVVGSEEYVWYLLPGHNVPDLWAVGTVITVSATGDEITLWSDKRNDSLHLVRDKHGTYRLESTESGGMPDREGYIGHPL